MRSLTTKIFFLFLFLVFGTFFACAETAETPEEANPATTTTSNIQQPAADKPQYKHDVGEFKAVKDGYVAMDLDGKWRPVFWRVTYTSWGCPYYLYEGGKGSSEKIANSCDTPYDWGRVRGDHVELFSWYEDGSVVAGWPLTSVTRDPRGSEWWHDNLRGEEQEDQAELVSQREIVGWMVGGADEGLTELVCRDIDAKYGIDQKVPRRQILADVRDYTKESPVPLPAYDPAPEQPLHAP